MIMPQSQYDQLNPFTPKPPAETIPKVSAGYNLKQEPTYYSSYTSEDCKCNAFKAEYYFGGKLYDKKHISYNLYNFKSPDEARKYFTDHYTPANVTGKTVELKEKSDSRLAVQNMETGGMTIYLTTGQYVIRLSGSDASDVIAFENNLPYTAFGVEKPLAQSADAFKEQTVSAITLLEEFNRDKVAAQNKYHGRFMKLTGVAAGSGTAKNGAPFLAFQLPNTKNPVGSTLACSFLPAEKERVVKTQNGETVQFRGRVNMKNPILDIPIVEECKFDRD